MTTLYIPAEVNETSKLSSRCAHHVPKFDTTEMLGMKHSRSDEDASGVGGIGEPACLVASSLSCFEPASRRNLQRYGVAMRIATCRLSNLDFSLSVPPLVHIHVHQLHPQESVESF